MLSSNYNREINISFPWDLPQKLSGPAVMFDVVSASFNMIYLVSHVKAVYAVNKTKIIDAIEKFPQAGLIGESDDPKLFDILKDKFLAKNSPTDITQLKNISNKSILLLTNNGTHTLNELMDKGCNPVIIGHWANLHAVTEFLLNNSKNNNTITLVPSGGREMVFSKDPNLKEDLYCAQAMQGILNGNQPDIEKLIKYSLDAMVIQYAKTKFPRQSTLDLIYKSTDKYPIVPICKRDTSGFLKIISEGF
jgi:phosphosulfolactate phosphohydrolase-like enzyme